MRSGIYGVILIRHGRNSMGYNVRGTQFMEPDTSHYDSDMFKSQTFCNKIRFIFTVKFNSFFTNCFSQIFPINIKGSAGSLVTVVNWLGTWIISYAFNFLMKWSSEGINWSHSLFAYLIMIPDLCPTAISSAGSLLHIFKDNSVYRNKRKEKRDSFHFKL